MASSERSAKLKKSVPIIAVIISVIYAAVLIAGNSTLLGAMWIVLSLLLAILILAIGMMAGAVVVKSLFTVAAELSLLIFLTQAYCSAPGRLPQNNAAMNSLFTVAIIYIGYLFVSSLWEALKEVYKKLEAGPRSWQRIITTIAFLFFIGLFVWELYLIIGPIVGSLCVSI